MAVPEFRAFSRPPVVRFPMVGPWFTTPWRLVSQSHGAVAWRFRSPCPSHVPFLFASSRHRRVPSVPWTPYPVGPCAALATRPLPPRPLVPSSRVYTPPGCQQPCGAGPLDPLPSGDRFLRLARVAPFPPPSLSPVPRPQPNPLGCCSAPSHPSSRVYTPPGHQQPCGADPLDPHPSGDRFVRLARVAPFLPFSPVPRPRPNPLDCCAAPSHPSSRVYTRAGRQQPCGAGPLDHHPSRGPFCAPSTGRSPPAPAPHSCAPSHAVLVPPGCRVALATRPFMSRLLVVLRGVVRIFFFFLPCFFPRGSLLPACTHNNTASPSVSVPFGALVQSHRHPVARPLAVPGHARWAPLPRDPAF